MTRADALAIVEAHVKNINLRRHMFAVEAAMRAYATQYHGDPEVWGLAGLLHDFDWEIHPTLEQHPQAGQSILAARGVPDDIQRAILAHAPHTGVVPTTDMEKCLFACDEITGLIVACALVTPEKKLSAVRVESVKKKLSQKSFAANVNRNDIAAGVSMLGTTLDTHISTVLKAMQHVANELGL